MHWRGANCRRENEGAVLEMPQIDKYAVRIDGSATKGLLLSVVIL